MHNQLRAPDWSKGTRGTPNGPYLFQMGHPSMMNTTSDRTADLQSHVSAGDAARIIGQRQCPPACVRAQDVSNMFYSGKLRTDLCPVVGGRRLIPLIWTWSRWRFAARENCPNWRGGRPSERGRLQQLTTAGCDGHVRAGVQAPTRKAKAPHRLRPQVRRARCSGCPAAVDRVRRRAIHLQGVDRHLLAGDIGQRPPAKHNSHPRAPPTRD